MSVADLFRQSPVGRDALPPRKAVQKHDIVPRVVEREEKKKSKEQQHKDFRAAVWARDKHVCRATKQPLVKSGTVDPKLLGEVDHVIERSLAPELIYDVKNGILLQKLLNRLKKRACPRAPEYRLFSIEGPADRGEKQQFIWRDLDGKIIRKTRG